MARGHGRELARKLEHFSTDLQDEAIRHLETAVALAPKRDEYLHAWLRPMSRPA